MVQIQGQFNRSDYLQAFKLHSRRSFLSWLFYCMCGVLAFLGILTIVSGEGTLLDVTLTLAPLLAVIVFLIVMKMVLLPLTISRQLKQLKDALVPMKAQFDENGWHFENEFGSYRLPWNAFVKWKEDGAALLLYRSSRMFQIVPKRMLELPSDLEYISGQLRNAGIRECAKSRLYPVQVVFSVLLGLTAIAFILNTAINRYLQLRDPVSAAEWQTIEKPGLLVFRAPGPPVDDTVSADELAMMAVDGVEPTAASWSALREGRRFNVRALKYSFQKSLTVDDLDLVFFEVEARFGTSNIAGYEEIARDGASGIRIKTRHPSTVTEAFAHRNRLFVASTDWPVDSDMRIFFDSIRFDSPDPPGH